MDRSPRTRTIAGAVGIASGAIVILRLALGKNSLHTLWAEDGAVFLKDALDRPVGSLTSSYVGYGHLLPRVLGELGHLVPIEHWPTLVAVTAAIVIGLISAVVYWAAAQLDLVPVAGVMAALVPALLPGLGDQVVGAWANLQWVGIAYALAWVLLVPPSRSRSGRAISGVVGLVALSGGATAIFVCPLLLLHGRRWYRHPAVPGLALGALYQVLVQVRPSVSLTDTRVSGIPPVRDLIEQPARALVVSGGGPLGTGTAATVVGLVVLVLALVAIARSPARRTGFALVGCAVAAFLCLSYLNGGVNSRYASFAVSLVVAGVLVCLGARETARPWLVWLVVGTCLAWSLALTPSPYRAGGQPWTRSVEQARAECRDGSATGATIVHLPVAPAHWWATVNLRCSQVG